jgi:hypothetical protein
MDDEQRLRASEQTIRIVNPSTPPLPLPLPPALLLLSRSSNKPPNRSVENSPRDPVDGGVQHLEALRRQQQPPRHAPHQRRAQPAAVHQSSHTHTSGWVGMGCGGYNDGSPQVKSSQAESSHSTQHTTTRLPLPYVPPPAHTPSLHFAQKPISRTAWAPRPSRSPAPP